MVGYRDGGKWGQGVGVSRAPLIPLCPQDCPCANYLVTQRLHSSLISRSSLSRSGRHTQKQTMTIRVPGLKGAQKALLGKEALVVGEDFLEKDHLTCG